MAGEFSEEDVRKAVDAAYRFAVQGKTPAAHPRAYILGGQPGAGKTDLQKEILRKCGYNAIVINGDEYRKLIPNHGLIARMPESRYAPITQRFANQVTEGMIEKAGEMSYNLIIEGTLRHKQTALNTSRLLQGKGYLTELSVLAVNREVSYYSTKLRTEKLRKLGEAPRMTATDSHNEVVKNLPRNVSELYRSGEFDNITVYGRRGELLYSLQETPETDPGRIVQDRIYEKTLEDAQKVHHIRQSISRLRGIHMQQPQIGL